ncbi:CARDB domain-containing protein [Desulfonema limicola]|uniref:CARDB domain-containing protein n=1 Tax=Desulfonema limicola TaxID=45656 RepID=UPI001A9BE22A|nr:CARDB domain-containing protein [Desulfonema limicola]
MKGWEATTFNNLIMSPLTNPHTVTIQIPMAVNGTFISGSSATNRVSFVKVASSDVTNAVTSYYCASNGGISNIDCVPGGPDAPSDFSAAAVSQTQIDLSWTCTAADETGFKIFRDGVLIDNIEGPVSGETWDNTTAAPDAVSYSDTGLTADTTYNYEIKTTVLGTDSTGVTASATTQSAASSLTVEMTYLFNVNNTEPGKYVPLVAYIKNIGTEALSATALVEFYVDGPDGFTADPAGTASAAGLKAGYSMNAYLNWKIPETAPGGVYTYTAQAVDGADALSEFSSGMNFNVASIAAYTAEVLRIMPASATDPAPATLKVLVRNKDTAALTGTVKFYVDSTEVGTAAITNLAAGRYFWYTYSWDTTGQGGSHTYNAQVFNSSDAAISKVSSSTGITVY